MVIVLAIGLKVRGLKPAEGDTNPQHVFLRRESKAIAFNSKYEQRYFLGTNSFPPSVPPALLLEDCL
jgi:hypothetical protein